jgi:putative ABC transport system permease protein
MSARASLHACGLAWRHLSFHGVRSGILVLSLAISIALPLVMQSLVSRGEQATTSRASVTPLLLGAPGGSVDLVLGALWFLPEELKPLPARESDEINGSGLATALPLSMTARASGYPVVGTDVAYLDFRGLDVADGRQFAVPGECVLGSRIAAVKGLGPGDTILTDPEGLFDIGGGYPLRLRITGVLAQSNTPDDGAVFCDLKTSWIIAGYGHVHVEVTETDDPEAIMGENDGRPIASSAVTPYTELTPELLSTLHFHGEPEDLPVEAIILVPKDAKSRTILSGRLGLRDEVSVVYPSEVVKEVLDRVFQIGALLAGILVATGVATLGVVLLVLALSIRLRKDELDTLRRIGAPRSATITLLLAEVVMLAALACVIAFAALAASTALPADLVLRLAT